MMKVAIITGASRGIGRAIATRMAGEGWSLAIQSTKSSEKQLIELASELSKQHGVRVEPFFCDFSSAIDSGDEEVQAFVESVLSVFEQIDGLVSNAGIMSEFSIEDVSMEELQRVFTVNTFVPYILTKLVFGQMKKQGHGGRIINVSSFVVPYGMGRNQSVQYAGTKAALEVLTTGLSRIGAEHQILVNTVRPGLVNTEMQKDREDLESRINMIPLKRLAESHEVASAVAYFLSAESSFVTGQTLSVAGGE